MFVFVFPKHASQQRAEFINCCVYPESAEAQVTPGQREKNKRAGFMGQDDLL